MIYIILLINYSTFVTYSNINNSTNEINEQISTYRSFTF